MKILACIPFVLVTASLGLAGCGSSSSSSDPFGPEPDYASVQQRFTNPTGTMNERNMGSIFTRYSEQKGAQSLGAVGSTPTAVEGSDSATATTHSKALHMLGGSTLTSACSALSQHQATGSCSCPEGGSFTYDFSGLTSIQQQSSGPIDASLKVRFESCHANALGIDGREFVRVHADRNGSTIDTKSLSMLLVADFTVSKGAETHEIDLAASLRNGEFELALSVDDGWVTVRANTSGSSGSGSLVVRDRNGSWTCDVSNGSGTCHDDKGNTRKF